MIIKEYRIVMPLSVQEFQVGQLFSILEANKAETGGGEGVEIVENEPFSDTPLFSGAYDRGQYTKKIYHLQTKVSAFMRAILPAGALTIHEQAWNAYPFCKTKLTNPDFMKDDFYVTIETIHLPDRGTTANAHNLSPEELAARSVAVIDIADDKQHLRPCDISKETSPSLFKSEKTGRGPLQGDWARSVDPVMCAYKLVRVHFKWFGLQNLVESYAHREVYPRVFTKFHREAFCWMDKWINLTMADIREMEDKAKRELAEALRNGAPQGMIG